MFVLWGGNAAPGDVTFKDCVGVNPGVLRPNWYGNCVATYGLKSVVFDNITCRAPTLADPIPSPGSNRSSIDNSMFVFYTSFGGQYPAGNRIDIKGWKFADLQGNAYTASSGNVGPPGHGKMAWTKADPDKGDVVAPFWFPQAKHPPVNVYVTPPAAAARSIPTPSPA